MVENQIAVVTGASRGIGAAIAKALAGTGASVIVNYQGSEERAAAVVAEIRNSGNTAEAIQCNVADYAACEAFFAEIIQKYGRIDILVNNAGITRDNLLLKMNTRLWLYHTY